MRIIKSLSVLPIKIPAACFTEIKNNNNPKMCTEPQKTTNSQTNPDKEEQSWKHHMT